MVTVNVKFIVRRLLQFARRQPRDSSRFNADPAWQPRRRAMALKGAIYMQSAL